MNKQNPFESPQVYSTRLDAREYVAATLRGEHIDIPAHLKDDAVFRDAVETELVTLLNKQLVDEAVAVGSELPRGMVVEDKVHSAAVRELIHLEQSPYENFQNILKLVITFRIRIDEIDVPDLLKDKLRPFVPPDGDIQQAA